ncbi:MAG: ATP-dependent Clp protease ATP-binding subunit [Chitinophagales bacterium]
MIDTLIYTPELKRAIQIAQSVAKEYHHAHFSAPHLLQGLLHNDIGIASFLTAMGKDIYYLRDWADVRVEEYPKTLKGEGDPTGDEKIQPIMEMSDLIRLQLNENVLTPFSVLISLLRPNVGFTKDELKTLPLTQKELLNAVVEAVGVQEAVNPSTNSNGQAQDGKTGASGQALSKYCVDKTALAKNEKLDPIVGRDREIRMITEILGRRTKPNVIIVGEPGVGKTALVDGFAQSIIAEEVPEYLKKALLFELDTGSLIAGASYKGEIEDRLKKIIKEVKEYEKAILFVDEIHALLDKNSSVGSGVANLLKPELARGEITVIGATTNQEYREFIETDDAFKRRFEVLKVDEPNEIATYRMLQVLLPRYEEHHQIPIEEQAIVDCVRLAKRYIKEKRLPDAAIDLMDRTMSAIRMMTETSGIELEKLSNELKELLENEELAKDEIKYLADLKWFHRQVNDKVSPILLGQLEDETVVDTIKKPQVLIDYLTNTLSALQILSEKEKGTVDGGDVASIVAHQTGIPIGKIQTKERERLLNMEGALRKRVVGQDYALKTLSDAVLEARSGLTKAGQPVGSFFLLGPTGTGKTELAKSLAEFLFNDENALVRFDMSEFKEEHSAALLYGAPPGYVGYKEGGLLVNKIRQKPYSVVLFDEIEKAHTSVFDVFLQILDEGKLHDKLDRVGDFSNAIILFTSNIGSQYVVDKFAKGEIATTAEMLEVMSPYFRPEFLGRLTEIIPFAPISEEVIVLIFNIQLKKLLKALHIQGIQLDLSDTARTHLANKGFSPKYGARPIIGVIRNQLRRPISKMIISGELTKGKRLYINIDENNELLWEISDIVE